MFCQSVSWLSPAIRLVIVGGEQASRTIYAQWRELFGVYPRWLNAYGPTEATVSATLYDPIAENFDLGEEIPIGRAIDNLETFILDEDLNPVKPGDAGELHIGGLGLAKGYLNRPEKTAAAFISHPFRTGDRLYKTGDIVSELPDGNIQFFGRADFQVKIRGFRIELGEIARCVEQYPDVQQQIVLAREDDPGEKRLVAYVVPGANNTNLDVSDLRKFVQKKLPDYMVPSNFVVLDELPVTTNGKVDRRALPIPTPQRSAGASPKTATEKTLATLWETVLSLKNVSATDNFFELGGSSLKAVHLFSLIEEEFGQKLPLTALLQSPTLTALATTLDIGENAALWDSLVPLQPHGDKPPLFFLHAVGPSILNYQNLLPYFDADQPVYALQAKGLDEKQPLLERMDLMAAQYIEEVKKVQPEGPYYLVGHSFGGIMAYEMAQQLYAQGDTVGLLGLFDSGTPALS